MRRTFLVTTIVSLCLIASTSFAYTNQQAEKGKEIFAKKCAMCHGGEGEGGVVSEAYGEYAGMKAPPIVGKGMLPNMKTAGNAYAYVKAHMPLQAPGSLSEADALDVTAFALMGNKVKADEQPLTADNAKKIDLHGKN